SCVRRYRKTGPSSAIRSPTTSASSTLPIFGFSRHRGIPNLNHPGNNTTGVTAMQTLFSSKRMGLLHQLLPSATSVVGLHFPYPPGTVTELPEVEGAARLLGIKFKVLTAGTDAEIDAVFASLPGMQAEALYVGASPLFFSRATKIVGQAARLAIPA